MRLATILFIAFLLGAAALGATKEAGKPADPEIAELAVYHNESMELMCVALVPYALADKYSYIGIFEGEMPPPSTDFDLVTVSKKGGGDVVLLCVR